MSLIRKLLQVMFCLMSFSTAQAFYNPTEGKWLSRDPIGENGGANLYVIVGNDPIRHWDYLGKENGEMWSGILGENTERQYKNIQGPGTINGPWHAFWYLLGGDNGANLTISSDLIAAAIERLDPKKQEVRMKLKKGVECDSTGRMRISQVELRDNFFTIEENPGFVQLGSWQLRITADCIWSCGPQDDNCCCECRAACQLKIFMSKFFTFEPVGYNPDNDSWMLFLPRQWARTVQAFHLNPHPSIFLSAEFNDHFITGFTKCD